MAKQNNQFPNPRLFPGIDGIISIGGKLNVETLCHAYSLGIFPWPCDDLPILWHCPEERGIIEFADFHIAKSLKKKMQNTDYRISYNQAFPEVIAECSKQKRKGQKGTWILPEMVPAYIKFHQAGYAHSVEYWEEDKLLGGLYGVYIHGVFSGESMFNRKSDTAKICLVHLVEKLKNFGVGWIDTQMVTPVIEAFGGKYISREDFLTALDREHAKKPAKKIRL